MYDVIIVGARCAGAPTAMLLAQRGVRVLLLDRATFPSDIMNSHYIRQRGIVNLQRWGLLPAIAASNCPPVREVLIHLGDIPLRGRPQFLDGMPGEYAPRRIFLDKILVDAAVAAGAELRDGFAVREILLDGERVVGVNGRPRGGASVSERATLVVGADGLHSLVASTAQAPTYRERPILTCSYNSYWSGVAVTGLEMYLLPRVGLVMAFPTNDGLTCLTVQWPIDQFQQVRSDLETHFMAMIARIPELADRVVAGRRETRFMGSADLPNFFRKPYGPGWALVGDAGYHRDPATASGISDAFRDAELLATAIEDGLAGRQPLMAALATYEQQRNAAALRSFEEACQFATLAPPTRGTLDLRAALRANQAETDRFLTMFVGTTPAADFYAPANIQRILNR